MALEIVEHWGLAIGEIGDMVMGKRESDQRRRDIQSCTPMY